MEKQQKNNLNLNKISVMISLISLVSSITFFVLAFLMINFFQSLLFGIIGLSLAITFFATSRFSNPNTQKISCIIGIASNLLVAISLFQPDFLEQFNLLIFLPIVSIIILSILEPVFLYDKKTPKLISGISAILFLVAFVFSSLRNEISTLTTGIASISLLIFSISALLLNIKMGKIGK